MALTNAQRFVIEEMQTLAKIEIAFKSRSRNVVEMYANENIGSLLDADIQSLPSFGGVTANELQGAKNALDVLATAMGEYIVGTPATKLIKICDKVNSVIHIVP